MAGRPVFFLPDLSQAGDFFPAPGDLGAEASHPTLFPTGANFKEVWAGTGEVKWHRLTWEQNPTQYYIANALEALPILEYRSAVVTKE